VHGTHEWDDCRQNPKNKRNNELAQKDQNQDRNRQTGNNGNNVRRREKIGTLKTKTKTGAVAGITRAMKILIMSLTASLESTLKESLVQKSSSQCQRIKGINNIKLTLD
jgi:hypothetical protein